ncbi:MAG: hypothetical protein ACREYC_00840, partial [Gammaproteobacteria bacterium]
CKETYVSAVGPVRVMRSLYGTGRSGERALCPLEFRAGIVEGRWTSACGAASDVGSSASDRARGGRTLP